MNSLPLRIDAHQHFWKVERGDYGWLTPALKPLYRDFGPGDLAPLLEDAGVDRTILVQAAPTVAETRFLLELAGRTDLVAGVVGWIDMESPDAATVLADLAQNPKLVGIRPMIHNIEDEAWITRPDLAAATEAVIDADLCFDALVRPQHLSYLLEFLERHPDLKTVIDHGAKPVITHGLWQPWADGMSELAERPGVNCKLSGLLTEAGPDQGYEDLLPYMEHLLATFGPERLMWGSDWPVLLLAGAYPGWFAIAERFLNSLDEADQAQVLGGTATRFYGV
ncbi:MAG: amidohydrolase family protein [Gammaproteobacteria bacterium]|nr:amidohydrolase family protein [Gammaproteobacteria bacterium]